MSKTNALYMDELAEAHSTIDDALKLFTAMELMMRVNAPMNDGSAAHEAVLKMIDRLTP